MDIQEAQIPKEWFCPITQELMKDPVMASDGFTYQKSSINQWFKKSNKSPLTGIPLANLNLIPNRALRHTIQQYLEKNKKNSNEIGNIKIMPQPEQKVNYELPDIEILFDSAVDGDSLYLKCEVIPPEKPQIKRNSCSIVCILDVSQSMDTDSVMGGKDVQSHGFSRLDLVKHSINTMVQFMEDTDDISLVPFSTSARIALPITKTTKAGKKLINQTTKKLSTVGTTNIWDGFKVSIELLKELYKRKNHNIFVVLLTDGQPNLNPPRGIVPTLIKFLDLEKLPRPNIHVFGYGYELDTYLLSQIAETGHGTYTYIPDCSMVGTAFVNFMASALSTITSNVVLKLQNISQKHEIIGYKKIEKDTYNIGSLQYGQGRQLVMKLPQRILSSMSESLVIGTIEVIYGEQPKTIKKQIQIQLNTNTNEEKMRKSIIRSKYLNLLGKLAKQKKSNLQSCFKEIDEFYSYIQLIHQKQPTQFTEAMLKELKNPSNENEGQVSKAFEKQEWFEKWGKHYIPSLFRAHLMQTCTNFKDPLLQLYGGALFEQNRSNMDTVFIKMAPPEPTAKKIAQFVYKPVPVDMGEYYNEAGGCIHEDCLVVMQDGSRKHIKEIKKGDKVKGGIVKCIVKTKVFDYVEMVKIGDLIITPWHPIKMDNEWIFPCQCPNSIKSRMFIETYYNFVMEEGYSLTCENTECIGLGHNMNDNPVTAHEYFSSRVISDLQRSRGYRQGEITIKKFLRDNISHKVVGIQMDEI